MAEDDGLDEIRVETLRDPRAHASAWFGTESNTKDTVFAAERIADAVERAGDENDDRFKQVTQFLNHGPLWELPQIVKLLRSIRTVLILVLLAIVANIVFAGERSRAENPCLVVAIADGDTLTARCGEPGAYEQVKLRISAIDAPEKRQPFGQRSRQSLAALCFQTEARITERDRDRYGRTVADVECRGQDVGQHQVRTGMAWVYERYARGYDALLPLQNSARDARTGLWADREPVAPWEWRRAAKDGSLQTRTD